jgi:hypothetical protein
MAQLKSGSTVGGQTIATTAQIGSAGGAPYKVSFFNGSGTWTRGNITNHVAALVFGGGGGGGYTQHSGGGGGGGGAHVVMNSAQAGASRTVTIGGGGNYSYNGSSGGQSKWSNGTDVVANGGNGGSANRNPGNGGNGVVNASVISSDVVTGGQGGYGQSNRNSGTGRWAPSGGGGISSQCGEDCQTQTYNGRQRQYPHPDGMGGAVGSAGYGGRAAPGSAGKVAVVEYTA